MFEKVFWSYLNWEVLDCDTKRALIWHVILPPSETETPEKHVSTQCVVDVNLSSCTHCTVWCHLISTEKTFQISQEQTGFYWGKERNKGCRVLLLKWDSSWQHLLKYGPVLWKRLHFIVKNNLIHCIRDGELEVIILQGVKLRPNKSCFVIYHSEDCSSCSFLQPVLLLFALQQWEIKRE